ALTGDARGLDRGDSTIDADDDLRAAVADLRDSLAVQAVAFFDAMGDVEIDVAAERPDRMPENGGGGDAIDVVIAVNDDPLLFANRAGDALRRRYQAWQHRRLV